MNFRRAVFILVVFLLLAGIHLFVFAQNISLKYQLTDLKVKLAQVTSHNRQQASQVARAEDLGQIEAAAKGQLGMVYPEQIIYIVGSREVNPAPSSPPDQPGARD